MLKVKLQYFGHLMQSQFLGKDLDAGKDWRQKGRGWQRMRWLDSLTDAMDMKLSKLWKTVKDRGVYSLWGSQRVGHNWETQQQKWRRCSKQEDFQTCLSITWKIPWTEEPGRLQSLGLLRVRQDWAASLSLFTFMHWRRKWQPTPVFLPGESQGRWSLVGCCLWGRTE